MALHPLYLLKQLAKVYLSCGQSTLKARRRRWQTDWEPIALAGDHLTLLATTLNPINTYTFREGDSQKIINFQAKQITRNESLIFLEKEKTFVTFTKQIISEGPNVRILVTYCHVSIRKNIRISSIPVPSALATCK